MKENPLEATWLCRLGLIRALNISYREAVWMEKNVPFEMLFYQSFLKAEQEYTKRIQKQQARKNRNQRRGR